MPSESTILGERYALESPLASGGMATVWRARDDVLARAVAVKILHPHLAEDEQFLERFRREALSAARLTHPHIVAIYDTGKDPDSHGVERHYIVMEYCGRGTLQDELDERGAMPPGRVVAIAGAICEALGYAHRAGIVHRDIKPGNVLISDDGTLKVGDFGIAKAAFEVQNITTTGSILGTVTYLSPEQVRGEELTPASDLYSLGVMMYELLVGRPPFVAESQLATAMKHLREAAPSLRSQKAGIPKVLDATVLKALSKDPAERYGSAEEMRDALVSAGGGEDTTAFPAAARAEPRRQSPAPGSAIARSEPWRLVPILLLVALAVALALALPSLFGAQDGPLGGGPQGGGGRDGGRGAALEVARAAAFDPPPGDGVEHPEEVPFAHDGNPETAWSTESYDDPLGTFKPGVGVVFDLGDTQEVDEVEVSGCEGCSLELRAGDARGGSSDDYGVVDETSSAGASQSFEGEEARYWLVWITGFPGGEGGSGSITEVRFLGS
ncbi:MAG: protein kinase domain-containing protein [Actinomycetota bacterium]